VGAEKVGHRCDLRLSDTAVDREGVVRQDEPAQTRWRAVNAPQLVALVRAGARFDRGKLDERPTGDPATITTTAA
jgi:hypothetical protein